MRSNRWVAVYLCTLILTIFANAQVIYIDVNGPNDPGTGTINDPFRKIQDAVNASVNGDVLIVKPGIYTGEGNHDIEINSKNIHIAGSDPNNREIVNSTVVDCNKLGRAFYIHGGVNNSCIIEGITITNGLIVDTPGGAGIFCLDSSSPIIRRCVLRNNQSYEKGGGIRVKNNCSPLIELCEIVQNKALEGGGICISSNCSPIVKNCLIAANSSLNGAGIELYNYGLPEFINCTIAGNAADYDSPGKGGAIDMVSSTMNINSCIIWGNTARGNSGKQIYLSSDAYLNVKYSDISNDVNDIRNASNITWGQGCVNNNPSFVNFALNGDANQWDFHLQSIYGRWDQNSKTWVEDSISSVCIDAGDPNLTYVDEPWQHGFRINMGYYGGTSKASISGNRSDLNLDGIVDFSDYALISSKWLQVGEFIEDLDKNGLADEFDLILFSNNWLWIQADANKDGLVNFLDYSLISNKWLINSKTIEDINGDGKIDSLDIIILSDYWLWQ